MPTDHSQPVNDLDAAARRAFRAACDRVGGPQVYAEFFNLSARTAQRIYAGQRDVPPGLAAQLADAIAADEKATQQDLQGADALSAWAIHCEQREEKARG